LECLNNLEELDLSDNYELNTFEKLGSLPQLRVLKVNRCKLESVFALPDKVPTLQVLYAN